MQLVEHWIRGFESRTRRAGWPPELIAVFRQVLRSETIEWPKFGFATLRDAEDDPDWRCNASADLRINGTDDRYDAASAAAGMLDAASRGGTIIPDTAAHGFLAVDYSAPYARTLYRFPFAAVNAAGGGLIA